MDSSKESKLWVRHKWERGTHPVLASGPPSSEVPGGVSVPWVTSPGLGIWQL